MEGVAAKLTERFEDILSKKEKACVKRSDLKEERKAESFALLMEATEKKVKLEERRTMLEKRKVALKKKKVEDRYRCGGRQDVDHKSGLFVCRCKNDHEFLHH